MTDRQANLSLSDDFESPTHEAWLALIEKMLKGGDFEKRLVSQTADAIKLQPLYQQRADAQAIGRGRVASTWGLCQRIDHPDPKIANELALADLEQGAYCLALVSPDSATARGYGLACANLDDLDRALKNIALDMITLRVEPSSSARRTAALIAALVARRGITPAQTNIAFGLDPLGAAMAAGNLADDWSTVGARMAKTVLALRDKGFGGALITCDTRPIHEAGGSEALELAAALAMAVTYLRALTDAGLSLDDSVQHLSWTMAIDADQFTGIAKLRALRALWARIEEASGIPPRPINIHAETAWRMMTKRDPSVNMLRATMVTFAASVGGADSLSVLPYTLPLGLPDELARRIARNTQTILMEETNLWRVTDPAAGSGAYETLTDELCERAWALFQEIEAAGGMAQHLTSGAFQKTVAATRTAQERAVAHRKAPITGTSEFPNLSEMPETTLNIAKPDPRIPPETRGGTPDQAFDDMVDQLAKGGTIASITPPPSARLAFDKLPSLRRAAPFEKLRDAADAHASKHGKRATVFLANLGPVSEHTTRAMWITNLLAVGGIDVTINEGFTNTSDIGLAFAESGALAACICGADKTYDQLAETTAQTLKTAGAGYVALAGKPGPSEGELQAAGVDTFIFAGVDVLLTLETLHGVLSIAA